MSKIWGTTLFFGETLLETIYGNYIVKVYQNIITKCIDEDYTKRPSLTNIKEIILSM